MGQIEALQQHLAPRPGGLGPKILLGGPTEPRHSSPVSCCVRGFSVPLCHHNTANYFQVGPSPVTRDQAVPFSSWTAQPGSPRPLNSHLKVTWSGVRKKATSLRTRSRERRCLIPQPSFGAFSAETRGQDIPGTPAA